MILGTSGRPVVELGGTSCYRQFTKGDIVCSLQWLDIGGEDGPEPVAAIFPAHRRVDAGAYVIPQANAYAFFKPNGTPTAHLASAAFNAVQHINGFPDRMTGFRVMEVLLDAAPDLVAMPSTMPTNLQAQYDAQKPVYGIEAKATLNGKVIKESLILMFTSRASDDDTADDLERDAADSPEQTDKVPAATEGDKTGKALIERHKRLMEMLDDERDRQSDERFQMAKDADYEDGLQWEPEDAEELLARGQAPNVYNRVKPIVEWVLGTEKRTRVDWKVLPRERDDEQGAEVKTKVLKFVSDVNRVPFKRSAAFKEMVVVGLSWLEDSASRDPTGEPIYSGHVSWRDVYRDSRSRELDYSDARYVFRQKQVDLDVAMAMFPEAKEHLKGASHDDENLDDEEDRWYLGERLTNNQDLDNRQAFGERSSVVSTAYVDNGRRESVRLIEAWYRIPETVTVFANGPLIGQPFDQANPEHAELKAQGVHVMNDVRMQVRVMICTEDAPLWDGPSPYRHDQFPLTPMWCYRRARDGAPYGIVRGIRDPQDDFNKRRSKALHILSTNRVIADEDSFDDPEILRREAARADGVFLKKRGSTVEFVKNTAEMTGNLELMQHNEALMQDISGVQSENLGRESNAVSGKAIIARQEQGSMVTASIFDNLRLAIQLQGEKQLSLVEQFYSEPKVIRIVGQRAPTEWIPINTWDEATGRVLNDITATKADFIVSEQDYRANMQQAQAEVLGEVLAKIGQFNPQVVTTVLDLWVDLLDIPNKDEFAARIRKATGQRDPTRQPTPEEEQAEQAAKDEQAEMNALQKRELQARVADLESKATSAEAVAMLNRVKAMLDAITAGGQVAVTPALAPVADEIMRGAGFKDMGGQDPNIVQPEQQPMQQAMPDMPPQPAQTGFNPWSPRMKLSDDDLELLTPEERAAYEADPDGDNDVLDAIDGKDSDDDEGDEAAQTAAKEDDGDKDGDEQAEDAPAGDTPAAAKPEADEAKEDADEDVAEAKPAAAYTFNAPADLDAKITALKTEERDAFKSLMEGEMTAEDYQAIKDRTESEADTLKTQKLKAELSAEMSQQQAERDWQNACNAFAAKVKAGEGVDYEGNKVLGRALDAEVRDLAANPDNANKPAEWFLAEAHKAVKTAMGLNKPAAPAPAAPPVKQRPSAATIPPSLSKLPVAAESPTTDDKWAHLRSLPGDKLEKAIAAMTPSQLDEYMNSEA